MLVFGQIGSVVGLVIEPLFKGSRALVERVVPATYVDITGTLAARFGGLGP